MGRFDTRSIYAIVGGTLISAFLIFKFEWHFIVPRFCPVHSG